MNIVLEFDSDWLEKYASKGELIPARIYLQYGDVCYPDDEWVDNPVVLLGWWLHSVDEILSKGDGQGIAFMEGPFFINVTPKGDQVLLESEDDEISWMVPAVDLAKEVMRAANQAAKVLSEVGLHQLASNLNKGAQNLRLKINTISGAG